MSGPAPQRSVHIATFGCQMNAYDSERISGLLASLGYTEVDQPQGADLIVLNTCSVRERAEQKVYSYVGALKRLKEAKPGLLIGVGGCVAQQEGDRLLKHIPHLDFVFGTGALERLPELVAEARNLSSPAVVLTARTPAELLPYSAETRLLEISIVCTDSTLKRLSRRPVSGSAMLKPFSV
jgi:tRNA-2-methylthio-N6-dimethylallyladenosine synthase